MTNPSRHASNTKRSNHRKPANGVKRGAAKRMNGAHPIADHRPTYAPSKKTVGATLGSAVGGLAIYVANHAWPGTVTPELAGMLTVIATFAVGWVVPPGAREAVVVTERGRRRTAVA
ncbi:MAG TPA: hypothetical protein VLX44_12125 [Xanthobacteraceae bacterium]|nr:hypothetical protein [Xanthobacteraceae bacterium]